MKISKHLKSVFWDVDPATIDKNKNRSFIITRVAEKGTWSDVLWLKKQYSKKLISSIVGKSNNVSVRTKSFWAL